MESEIIISQDKQEGLMGNTTQEDTFLGRGERFLDNLMDGPKSDKNMAKKKEKLSKDQVFNKKDNN